MSVSDAFLFFIFLLIWRCRVFTSGKPVITRLSKQRAEDAKHKILTCEADGVPEPSFQWSVNGTSVSVRHACVCVDIFKFCFSPTK